MISLTLAMMIKDDITVFRALDSVRSYIDFYVIENMGNPEFNIELREYFTVHRQKYLIFDEPFQNFGYNTTQLLHRAQGHSDYILLMDPDQIFHCTNPDFKLKNFDKLGYSIPMKRGSLNFENSRLLQGSKNWTSIGITYNYIDIEREDTDQCQDFYLEETGESPWRYGDNKFQRDIKLLTAALETETDEKLRSRYLFYLAQSYRWIDKNAEAIPWYKKYIAQSKFPAEKYWAMYSLSQCQRLIGDSDWIYQALDAYIFRPSRLESLDILGYYSCNNVRLLLKSINVKMPTNDCFVDPIAYRAVDFNEHRNLYEIKIKFDRVKLQLKESTIDTILTSSEIRYLIQADQNFDLFIFRLLQPLEKLIPDWRHLFLMIQPGTLQEKIFRQLLRKI